MSNSKILKALSLGVVLLTGSSVVSTDGWGAGSGKGFMHQIQKYSPTTKGKAMRMESGNKKRDRETEDQKRLNEAREQKQRSREEQKNARENK